MYICCTAKYVQLQYSSKICTFAGQLDLGVHPVPTSTTNGVFSGALNTEANIDALLSNLGPDIPFSSEALAVNTSGLNGLNGYGELSHTIAAVPPPPPPPSTTCTSLYVKNLPPETDRLWLYERFDFLKCHASYSAVVVRIRLLFPMSQ